MKTKLTVLLGLLALLSLSLLTACSPAKNATTPKQQLITIATNANSKPNTYMDNGKLTGYDIELARAVFAKLPEYKLKFQLTDFNSVLTGIDSGRYQMGADALSWNAARAEKYLYSSPLSKSATAVAAKPGQNIKTLDDLAGKSTEVLSGVQTTTLLENWNKSNPSKAMKLNYMDTSYPLAAYVADVDSSKIDFVIYDQISLLQMVKDHGYHLQVYPVTVGSTDPHDGYEYFLFGKDALGQTLQTKVNKVLKTLQADGTLKKLSEQFLGGNFTPTAAAMK